VQLFACAACRECESFRIESIHLLVSASTVGATLSFPTIVSVGCDVASFPNVTETVNNPPVGRIRFSLVGPEISVSERPNMPVRDRQCPILCADPFMRADRNERISVAEVTCRETPNEGPAVLVHLAETALAHIDSQLEVRAQTLRGGIVRRTTSLLRLSPHLTSTAAVLAACWTSATYSQQASLPSRPAVTAVGPSGIIQTAARPFRAGIAARKANAAAEQQPQAPQPNPGPAAPPAPPMIASAIAAPALPEADQFRSQLDLAIEVSSRRTLTANSHSPWQIFHGLLALKQDFQLHLGDKKVNAIHWISTAEPKFDNQLLLSKTPFGGKFHSFTRPYAFEGHPAQFLALLSQSDLPVGHTFKVGPDSITLGGIINNTMKEVNTHEEVTWVLWGLQHYLKPDTQWVNQHNEPWSIERLVQIETAAPVVGAPCGGNHRLFALTRTRDKHLKAGGLVGVWAQADHKIRQHIEIARSMQNYDGTFSAKFYETSGFENDLNKRFNTTGHTMEFLSIGLPDERLNEQWVRNAVTALCNDLIVHRQKPIDCGPLYHTLNALIIYRERIRNLPTAAPARLPEVAQGVKNLGKPVLPVTTPVGSKPLLAAAPAELKTGLKDKATMPQETIAIPEVLVPQAKVEPSAEALNELRLDDESRERLNALKEPRSVLEIAIPDSPLGEPTLELVEEPASALEPEND
jgi:hypothetical protein